MSMIIRKCKIIDNADDTIQVDDIKRMFKLTSDSDFKDLIKYIDTLFVENQINWKIVGENTIFRRKSNVYYLNPNETIGEMIQIVRDIDRII